jgi:hypothetical protein
MKQKTKWQQNNGEKVNQDEKFITTPEEKKKKQ